MIPALDVGVVVRLDAVLVHQLARVVRLVAGALQPDGQVVVVEALGDELGVASVGLHSPAS